MTTEAATAFSKKQKEEERSRKLLSSWVSGKTTSSAGHGKSPDDQDPLDMQDVDLFTE